MDFDNAPIHRISPGVLVVVPTLNEAAHIEGVLAQLGAERDDADRLYVVADGGSTDGTQAIVSGLMARMPQLRLLHNPMRLQSAAVNLAVAQYGTGAHVLVRCDAHAGYPPDYVSTLVTSLEQQGADAVVVPMDSVGTSCVGHSVAWVSNTIIGTGGSAHRGGRSSGWVDHGHHAAFRMASFMRAGGYDETFSHNEDAELDCRQIALGNRIYLDASIRVTYYPRNTLRGLWRQYFNYGRGRARTVRKHPESLRIRQFAVPAHMLLCALTLLAMPWFRLPLVWPAAYLLVLCATAVVIAVRHHSACGLLCAPAALTMHVAWALGFILEQMRGGRAGSGSGATASWSGSSSRDTNAACVLPGVPRDQAPRISYFAHHAEDPAYRRRIEMFQAGGAVLSALLGFSRERPAPLQVAGVPLYVLGYTEAANFTARIRSVLVAALRKHTWVPLLRGSNAVVARNLECLALAALGLRGGPRSLPLHYEVLDIHRLMLREDAVGRAMRALERRLMRRCSSVIVSSPAFAVEYFDRYQTDHPPIRLVENKVFPPQPGRSGQCCRPTDGKLRIGWFGNIRCRKSLRMLKVLAAEWPDRVEVHIRGVAASTAIPDFEAQIRSVPNLWFHGKYANPDDLPRIYGEVDIAWAIDFFEEGQNSLMLLPNRLYESCLFGCVPLALLGTETARWMQLNKVGLVLRKFELNELIALVESLSPATLALNRAALSALDGSLFECTRDECEQLVLSIVPPGRTSPSSCSLTNRGGPELPLGSGR